MNQQPVIGNSAQWLSRTIAILLVMVGPGLLGSVLDRRLGTGFFTPAGLVLGMCLATFLLLLLAKRLTPAAGGRPISFEDELDGPAEETHQD